MVAPDRVPLALLPTPCHPLRRVSEDLGLDVWIKRDDLTGLAFGGNKGRKLEYIMGEAVRERTQVIVTCGAAQSNFIRQLGAACAMLDVGCVAAVMRHPQEPGHEADTTEDNLPDPGGANLLLDSIVGVEVHHYPDGSWEELYGHADELAAEQSAAGRRATVVPVGGSSAAGAFGFVAAAEEVRGFAFDAIICPTSSGSTHAGLAWAFADTATKVRGIACDPEYEVLEDVSRLTHELHQLTDGPRGLSPEELELYFGAVGPGYGVPSKECIKAIRYLAKREGIFLDPVYSGKAFAGLMDLARTGELHGRVLFWHTGGLPALFAYERAFDARSSEAK